MSLSSPLEGFEETLRSMQRKGGALAEASSSLSNVLEVRSAVSQLIKYADCLASAKGSCINTDSTSLCDVACGSMYVLRSEGETKVWKVGGQAISIVYGTSTFSVSSKDFALEISRDGYKVRLREGRFSGSLSEEDLRSGAHLISEASRKLLPQVRSLIDSLISCAKASGVRC